VQDFLGAGVAVVQRKQQLEPDIPHLLLREARAGLSVASDFAPQIAALAELHYDPYFGGLFVDYPKKREEVDGAAAAAAHLS
jgi:hypothetical protein